MLLALVISWICVIIACTFYNIRLRRSQKQFTAHICIPNKVVIVTGGNSGIGYETARELSRRAGRVILACRNLNKAKKAAFKIQSETGFEVLAKHLDLASFRSILAFAKHIIKTEKRVDILINNAATGVLDNRLTEDRLPIESQINYFGPFLLTMLLLPAMKNLEETARIINISSIVHVLGTVFNLDRQGRTVMERRRVYANSKLAILLFTRKLAEELLAQKRNIIVNCCHPGVVYTDMFQGLPGPVKWLLKWFFLSPKQGAQTSIFLAVRELDGLVSSGKYYSNCHEDTPALMYRDGRVAQKLWDLSLKVCFNRKRW